MPTAAAVVQEIHDIEAILFETRDAMSAALHSRIASASDARERAVLLAVRRAMYTLKLPRGAEWSAVSGLLTGEVSEVVSTYWQRLQKRSTLILQFSRAYDDDLEIARKAFRTLTCDGEFQRGLQLASDSLWANAQRYSSNSPAVSDGRRGQVERGLLRYFTRFVAKATPFGRFCTIVEGCLESQSAARGIEAVLSGTLASKRSRLRINKAIQEQIFRQSLGRKAFRAVSLVDLNPSLSTTSRGYRVLRSLGVSEAFQHINANEAVDVVIGALKTLRRGTLGDLVQLVLRATSVEATQEEAEAYIEYLANVGLIRIGCGIANQEAEWVPPLRDLLLSAGDPESLEIATLLDAMIAARERLVVSDASARESDLRVIDAAMRRINQVSGQPDGAFKHQCVFEDGTADARLVVQLSDAAKGSLDAMGAAMYWLSHLSRDLNEMSAMAAYFSSRYTATGVTRVPLLTFYEDYYRDHFKDHSERLRKGAPGATPTERATLYNPFASETVARRHAAMDALAMEIRRRWAARPEADVCDLPMEIVKQVVERFKLPPSPARSVSAFCDLALVHSSQPLVIWHRATALCGFGKYFSRFLYLFPEDKVTHVREENARLGPIKFADIESDGCFNANLHPRILRHGIAYPTTDASPATTGIRIEDLVVEVDSEAPERLRLIDDSVGDHVVPVDLGFLTPLRRPPLYRLLASFNASTSGCTIPIPEYLIPGNTVVSDGKLDAQRLPPRAAAYRPRITLGNRVVLARRRWAATEADFPRLQPGEGDAQYFLRANGWRISKGMPPRVYARVQPVNFRVGAVERAGLAVDGAPDDPEDSPNFELEGANEPSVRNEGAKEAERSHPQQVGRPEWSKPQYVDFESGLVLGLLSRITGDLEHFDVLFEEALPDEDDLLDVGGEAMTCEFVLQFDRFRASVTSNELA